MTRTPRSDDTEMPTPATVPRALRRGRPRLYTSYAREESAWNTPAKAWWTIGLVVLAVLTPFFATTHITSLLTLAAIYAIGGIGLNLLTGYAGQISLGHALFVGVGAYTAAVFGGTGTRTVYGLGWDMALWLPLTALIPGLLGLLVAPLAARTRGLYPAVLTLGLVMIGEHVFTELRTVTGGGMGRAPTLPVLFGADLREPVRVAGILINEQRALYLISLVLLVIMAILARNLMCSTIGRSFAAIRDRDIAAEMLGVRLQRTKTMAFVVSSAYAGVAGGLLSVVIGRISPERWNLLLSVEFLAIVLIGGAATITGSIIGACFVVLLPRVLESITHAFPAIASESGQILGFTLDELKTIVLGLLIAGVIVLEPRGMFGLWLRIRDYFRTWPFSH